MLPSPDILNEFEHGKFVLSNLAAKRAKQLKDGALALVQVDSTHPLTIALAEIAAGKIKALFVSDEEAALEAGTGVEEIIDVIPLEDDGMLLVGEDDDLHPTLGLLADHDEEHEDHEEDHDEEDHPVVKPQTLADIVEDEDADEVEDDAVEPVAAEEGSDDLSLNELAEQENPTDEDEESND